MYRELWVRGLNRSGRYLGSRVECPASGVVRVAGNPGLGEDQIGELNKRATNETLGKEMQARHGDVLA